MQLTHYNFLLSATALGHFSIKFRRFSLKKYRALQFIISQCASSEIECDINFWNDEKKAFLLWNGMK